MLFYLTTLNIARFLRKDAPIVGKKYTNEQNMTALDT